jgi:biopolymer transport protein ExbD
LIIRIAAILGLAVASLMPIKVSYAADTQPTAISSTPLDVVFVDLPILDMDGTTYNGQCPIYEPSGADEIENLRIHQIFFDQNGSIFWNDGKVANDNLDELLTQNLVADGFTELQFYPSENAPAGVAINALKRINSTEFPCFGFVGNEQYRKIWKSKTPNTQPWSDNSVSVKRIQGRAQGGVSVQVIATDNQGREINDPGFSGVARNGRCRVYFNNQPVSSDELAKVASNVLEVAIDQAGGIEKWKSRELLLKDLPDAVIITTPDTPWRCVGGAIFNFQIAGFVRIGFAVVE